MHLTEQHKFLPPYPLEEEGAVVVVVYRLSRGLLRQLPISYLVSIANR